MSSKHEIIVGNLITDILSGHYRVGERLPSERDLAVRFDANRGAVRECMKKLEQIGLADVQPGGTRVKDKQEASLDIIGHLLHQGDAPDPLLVEQILIVLNSLISTAADQALMLASDAEIARIRKLTEPLYDARLNEEEHLLARIELMSAIMHASHNLPLQLTARTLFEQTATGTTMLHNHLTIDRAGYRSCARQLDAALAKRDRAAVRGAFEAMFELHRQTTMQAFAHAGTQTEQEMAS